MQSTSDASGRILIIAEVAQAHDGSLGIAHSYIDALSATGIDAIKFQTHIAEAESSPEEPFRIKFSKQDATRFDYWRRMEFSLDQWVGLKEHCDQKKLEFISSPFSTAAVTLLERVGVKRYKVGSGEINNFLMLESLARTGKEIILSSGMSSIDEIGEAVRFLEEFKSPVSILQCTTKYPTAPEDWGLNMIPIIREKFNCRVGFSDHSGERTACLAAATLGAEILEFHAVFDKRIFGPDTAASMTVDEISSMVCGVRNIEKALHHPVDKDSIEHFSELKRIFGKSLAVNNDFAKGHRLEIGDLESKKPAGMGISAKDYRSVIGKRLTRDIPRYAFLKDTDLANE